MKRWSGTARRLFIAFAALIGVYGIASSLALMGLAEIHRGLQETRKQAEGVRLALDLASAVRDQYAHQAHTIIIGDSSHLGFYADAERHVLELARRVREHAARPDELAWVDGIEEATGELDAIFRQHIVPAVLSGQRANVQSEHARARLMVSRIQENVDRLAARFEQSIGDLQAHVSAVERRVFRLSLFFLLGATVLAVGVGAHVGRSVARPVARLQAGAERLARGDLETRIEIDRPDEFGALAHQFNAMTASLKEHQERLVQNEKLAGIGRLAAGVAHEINNPIGVILGYTHFLKKRGDHALAEDLRVVEEEALRCRDIVQDLLDLARPYRMAAQPVNLRELTEDVVGRLAEARRLDGVAVSVEGSGTAEGDAQRLGQVLLNLVRNAAEAAGSGGRVEVRVAERGPQVEVEVSDTGPGIGLAARGRLFEPFFTTKAQGTGLGLAVSRAIARAHGGEILAGPAAIGGARFSLQLPHAGEGGAR